MALCVPEANWSTSAPCSPHVLPKVILVWLRRRNRDGVAEKAESWAPGELAGPTVQHGWWIGCCSPALVVLWLTRKVYKMYQNVIMAPSLAASTVGQHGQSDPQNQTYFVSSCHIWSLVQLSLLHYCCIRSEIVCRSTCAKTWPLCDRALRTWTKYWKRKMKRLTRTTRMRCGQGWWPAKLLGGYSKNMQKLMKS